MTLASKQLILADMQYLHYSTRCSFAAFCQNSVLSFNDAAEI